MHARTNPRIDIPQSIFIGMQLQVACSCICRFVCGYVWLLFYVLIYDSHFFLDTIWAWVNINQTNDRFTRATRGPWPGSGVHEYLTCWVLLVPQPRLRRITRRGSSQRPRTRLLKAPLASETPGSSWAHRDYPWSYPLERHGYSHGFIVR